MRTDQAPLAAKMQEFIDTQAVGTMKTIIFCTSYMGHSAAWQRRYKPWVDYYTENMIGADRLFLIDDGSPFTPPEHVIHCVDAMTDINVDNHSPTMVRFKERLGRSSLLSYPGWWRSFLHSVDIARQIGADKIIHIESDAYILSNELFAHMESLRSGWTCLWSPHFRIPETAIQVICADQFRLMDILKRTSQNDLDGKLAEEILPFTHIEKLFEGDRYGDIRKNRWVFRSRKFHHWPIFQHDWFWAQIPPNADFATQVTERLWRNSMALKEKTTFALDASATP
jgi:hypothetical protein